MINSNLLRCIILTLINSFMWSAVSAQSHSNQIKKTEGHRVAGVYRISEADTLLVNAAAATVRVAPKMSRVWKKYWSPAPAFIIYKPGKSALLVSEIVPPPPFQPISPVSLPRELRGKTYFYRGALAGLAGNFNTEYRIGEQSAIAVKLEESTYQTLDVLFHEGFHEFQKKAFAPTLGADAVGLQVENWIDPQFVSKPEFVAAMEVERRILSQAITAASRDLKSLLRQYLAVRARRTQNLPADARQAELNIERKEGTAATVGSEVAFMATGQDRKTVSEQLKMFLAEPPKSLPMGNFPYERFRARSFGSGAALGWLLTRMKVNWRERSQQGASFETLLAEAVNYRAEADTASVETTLQAFGFPELLKEAETWKSKVGSGFTAADFYRKGKFRLVVEIPSANKEYPEFKGQGVGLPSQPEENIIIFPNAQALSLNYQKISLDGEKRPYLLDFKAAPKLYRITIMLDELPTVEGSKEGETKIQWTNGGIVKGAGIILKVERPAIVILNNHSVTVQIESKPS